jgi:hypothetical protein
VYFALAPLGVVHYSTEAVWPFTRLTCLLLVGVCCLAAQRAKVEATQIVQGLFGFALCAGALPAAVFLLETDLPGLHGAFDAAAGGAAQRNLLVLAVLDTAVFIWLQRRLQNAIGTTAAALGALVWIACLLLVVSWLLPGASYLLVWPLLAATTAIAALHSRRVAALPQALRGAILCGALAPGVVLIVPAVRDAFTALAPARMNLTLTLLAVLLGLGTTLLAAVARRFAVRTLALASLACLALSGNASPSRPPALQPNPLVYYKDMPTWRAWWLATPALDEWSRQRFPNLEKPRRLVEVFGWDSDDLWYSPAERNELAFPYAILLKDEEEPRRHVEFMLTSKNRAPHIKLWIKNGKPRRTAVNGRVLTDSVSRTWSLSLYGMEDRPLHFSMDMAGNPTFQVHVEERMPGIPENVLPQPLEAGKFIPMSGTTVAADVLLFR